MSKVSFIDGIESPRLYYTDLVANQINYLVDKCKGEVGWLGLMKKIEDYNAYLVTELFVPEQEVHGSETDIKPAALIALHEALEEAGKDPNDLRYWGHSHVNMATSPSNQDLTQVKEYREGGVPFFVMAIYNKKGDSNVEFYDFASGIRHAGIWNGRVAEALSKEDKQVLDDLIEDNVKSKWGNQSWKNKRNNGYVNNANRNVHGRQNHHGNQGNSQQGNQKNFPLVETSSTNVNKKKQTSSGTRDKEASQVGKKGDKASHTSQVVPVKIYNSKNEIIGEKDLYWNENIGFYGKGAN